MPRYVAFLRAVNIGGRIVKMDHLKRLFETMGFTAVETFIASGNVIFESRSGNRGALEKKIEAELKLALGYEVSTFVRTCGELAAVASYAPFAEAMLEQAAAFNVAFIGAEVEPKRRDAFLALQNEIHDFHVRGLEVYWLSKVKQSDSRFKTNDFERVLGVKMTLRGINTVRRMADRWGASDDKETRNKKKA